KFKSVNVSLAVIVLIIAYIIGHILASPAKILLEILLINKCLGQPTTHLLIKNDRWYTKIIPDYFAPLPESICSAIMKKVPCKDSEHNLMKSIFTFVEGKLRYKDNLTSTLDIFLTQYGFCRNISFTLLIISLLFFGVHHKADLDYRITIATAALVGSIVMFLRSLKFHRQYAYELLVTYGASVLTKEVEKKP
ncbi:hypothetical protein AMJ87_07630, partial [candidate division WOR_3 bacterium SM23_60]